jgi:hypothetical protein
MSQIEANIFNACNEDADLIINSTNVQRKYELLFLPNTRYTNGEASQAMQVPRYKNAKMIRDKDAPEANGGGCQVWLNTRYVSKAFLPPTKQSALDVFRTFEQEMAGSNGEDVKTPVSIPCRVIPLARTGDYSNYMVKSTWQLKITRRNACALVQDIAIT